MLNLTFADWHSTFSYYDLFVVIKAEAKPVVFPTPTDKYVARPEARRGNGPKRVRLRKRYFLQPKSCKRLHNDLLLALAISW